MNPVDKLAVVQPKSGLARAQDSAATLENRRHSDRVLSFHLTKHAGRGAPDSPSFSAPRASDLAGF